MEQGSIISASAAATANTYWQQASALTVSKHGEHVQVILLLHCCCASNPVAVTHLHEGTSTAHVKVAVMHQQVCGACLQ